MRIFKETCQRSYEFHPALDIVVFDDADRKTRSSNSDLKKLASMFLHCRSLFQI